MSIRWRILTVLFVMTALFAATAHVVQRVVLYPSFVRLEEAEAVKNLQRAKDAIALELEHLSSFSRDWASWDDMYTFLVDRNDNFKTTNLVPELFVNNRINLLYVADAAGQCVWSDSRGGPDNAPAPMPHLFAALKDSGHRLLTHPTIDHLVSGVLITERGPMLVSSRPVLTGKNQGPARGTLVAGRLLDASAIATLAERLHMQIDCWSIPAGEVPDADRANLDVLQRRDFLIETNGPADMHIHSVLKDLDGKPALMLRVAQHRSITERGDMAARIATAMSMVGSLLGTLVIYYSLRQMVINPLLTVTRHVQRIGETDDLKSRLALARSDEIGVLAGEFDRMVARLDESRTTMLDTAHRAGMAETATGVLHNVGNAINTVNIKTELLAEQLKASKVTGLEKAAALLKEQQPRLADFVQSDPRAPKLVDYLISLSETLSKQQAEMLAEVTTLQTKVQHIKEIVATQQAYAGAAKFEREEDLIQLVDDAIRMNDELLDRHHVAVEKRYSIVPHLPLNRVKLMQVLTNLVKNAAEAIRDTARGSGRIVVTIAPSDEGGALVRITDDGVGVKKEHLTKSFSHGFTTKHDGHGFGLHYCANAMTEMGGRIRLESEGEGKGATFELSLPPPATAEDAVGGDTPAAQAA